MRLFLPVIPSRADGEGPPTWSSDYSSQSNYRVGFSAVRAKPARRLNSDSFAKQTRTIHAL
jgi:hypothetical protein